MAYKVTDESIAALPRPKAKGEEMKWQHPGLPYLWVRSSLTSRRWYVIKRTPTAALRAAEAEGRKVPALQNVLIGTTEDVSESEARALAGAMVDQIDAGVDAAKARKPSDSVAVRSEELLDVSFGKWAKAWLATKRDVLTHATMQNRIEGWVPQYFRALPIESISTATVNEMLDQVVASSKRGRGHRKADMVATDVQSVLEYYEGRAKNGWKAPAKPANRVDAKAPPVRIRRAFTAAEFREVWTRTADVTRINVFVRLALLTGARLKMLQKLRWSDVDFDRGSITLVNPAQRAKKTSGLLLLPKFMIDTLRVWREQTGDTTYVFPGRAPRGRPSTAWYKKIDDDRTKLAEACGFMHPLASDGRGYAKDAKPWRWDTHCLRHTATTHLIELEGKETSDAIVGRKMKGSTAIYMHGEQLKRKARGMGLYAKWIADGCPEYEDEVDEADAQLLAVVC